MGGNLEKEGFHWKRYSSAREMVYEQVTSWLGNSPAVMAKHYRKAKGKKEAYEWFFITPAVIETAQIKAVRKS